MIVDTTLDTHTSGKRLALTKGWELLDNLSMGPFHRKPTDFPKGRIMGGKLPPSHHKGQQIGGAEVLTMNGGTYELYNENLKRIVLGGGPLNEALN